MKRLRIWWARWRRAAAVEALRKPTAPVFRRRTRAHIRLLERHINTLSSS